MSIYMQYAPYKLKGSDWETQRKALGATVVKTLAQYAPDLPELILNHQIITPQDLEETYGLTGGHIFHGELALDQFFTMRPLAGLGALSHADQEPVSMRISGTHPGAGLTGGRGRTRRGNIERLEEVAAACHKGQRCQARSAAYTMKSSAILLIACPDQKGVVATISDFVFRHNGNILHADEHADEDSNLFLMRVEFDPADFDIDLNDFTKHFSPIATKFEMHWRLAQSSTSPENGDSWSPSTITAWWICCTGTRAANWPAIFR